MLLKIKQTFYFRTNLEPPGSCEECQALTQLVPTALNLHAMALGEKLESQHWCILSH